MDVDLTPDPDEVVQAEEKPLTDHPISVSVCGPVETRELPAVRAGYFSVLGVGTAVGVRLLSFEPRRKSAVILPAGHDVWLSNSQAGAQTGGASGFRLPAGQPFEITHLDEVWACSTSETADVSVATTFWSE